MHRLLAKVMTNAARKQLKISRNSGDGSTVGNVKKKKVSLTTSIIVYT
jgi:hypothetical protein